MGSSSNLLKVCLSMLVFAWIANAHNIPGVYNVMHYGAVADGKFDCANAFLSAWTEACACSGSATILIPQGTFLSSAVSFKGPCKSALVFQIIGKVVAPVDLLGDNWICFEYVKGLTLTGGGTFDGQGSIAWSKQISLGFSKFPVNIRFNYCTDAIIQGISSINSKLFHIDVLGCKNIKFIAINVSAPKTSVSTDGIRIGMSTGITVSSSFIGTGDNCIFLGPGSQNIYITKILFGAGHGITIGSLGSLEKEEAVHGITVRNCTFTGTENGIRIERWHSSIFSFASNMIFEDLIMNHVKHPILIDEPYCPLGLCTFAVPTLVKISDVIFKNIRGTCTSELAVKFMCSLHNPCVGVQFNDIDLMNMGSGRPALALCSYVKSILSGNIFPSTCF
ncbi:hypothetical protein GIB67_000925 [Kingdonia uniflora]|uniref:Exopolygalacturonase n=1 Tax=Kingdonia uniflora TaxID=39325 RepID=A0A7J7MFV3_9MAGN|nr:hypothetical protein GIB67_000925 [Kingdonia uniflora]